MRLKIATFNVNSIRSRLPVLLAWLESQRPDILCLQETKVEDRDFPAAPLEEAGYHAAVFGQKRWNGVAILSRQPLAGVERGLVIPGAPGEPGSSDAGAGVAGDPAATSNDADAADRGTGQRPAGTRPANPAAGVGPAGVRPGPGVPAGGVPGNNRPPESALDGGARGEGEARLIRAECAGVAILNAYVPQGRAVDDPHFQYKLAWLEALADLLQREYSPSRPLLLCGDLNHAPEPIDVYDPEGLRGNVCFHPEVDRGFRKLLAWGLSDLFRRHCPEPGRYSFFDYRVPNAVKRGLGWRLDHILVTAPLAARATACFIDTEPRLAAKPSDHTPVVAEFEVG